MLTEVRKRKDYFLFEKKEFLRVANKVAIQRAHSVLDNFRWSGGICISGITFIIWLHRSVREIFPILWRIVVPNNA